ncbi:hypothetical protein BRADI_2g26397v3 [Brachypodium distachyon]|uniref:Reverse transcriptase zinc-binding domain-containing protein n=1 Tax=Brachypodium distachyon TaxID=15368 RepID=A0A2K2DAN7_BRADI|nr:hypothetical protein BRADI_2g26397v3 [Brachypodium distachyon]
MKVAGRGRQIFVAEALVDRAWVKWVKPDLSSLAIDEFLLIWDIVEGWALSDEDDVLRWKWEGSVDRLRRRKMPHPPCCPLCDQVEENINHLLLGCVVAWQVWLIVLGRWQRQDWLPGVLDRLETWWPGRVVVARKDRRNLHTAVNLVYWCIWKHRNAVVFDGVTPSVTHIIREIGREGDAW